MARATAKIRASVQDLSAAIRPDGRRTQDSSPRRAVTPPAPAQRRTFRDQEHQESLERFGYAVVPFLDSEMLAAVKDAHERLGPAPDDPRRALNWTFHSTSSAHKQQVKAELLELAEPALDAVFQDHEAYLTTFITKWPGPDSAFAPHQDPSLVDERHFTGVTVWIPLSDTGSHGGKDNGMLHVVPGSHRFSRALRVSDVDRSPFAPHEEAIVSEYGRGVPTTAGEALVFDNRVIHYSMPNQTEDPRVVLAFGMRPAEGACVLLREDAEGMVEIHQIPDDFYIDVLPAEQHLWRPEQPPIAKVDPVEEQWTTEEFADLCSAVGPAPRAVRVETSEMPWRDPSVFCALCGSSEGLSEADRAGRNNAQLVCPTCEAGLAKSKADHISQA